MYRGRLQRKIRTPSTSKRPASHGTVVAAPVAPHVAVPVTAEFTAQTAGAVSVARTPVIMTRADSDIWVSVPRRHMVLASQSGSCDRGGCDQCGREKSRLAHSISPSDRKSQQRLCSL